MSRFEGVEYGSKEYRRLHSQEWRAKHPEKARQQKRNWRKKNPEKNLKCAQASRHKHPITPMLAAARARAKLKNIEFSLTKEDIFIPQFCPVLGIELQKSYTLQPWSPSLDRIDNSKGYVKDNVKVISLRANQIKNNANIHEIESILKYMKEHIAAN